MELLSVPHPTQGATTPTTAPHTNDEGRRPIPQRGQGDDLRQTMLLAGGDLLSHTLPGAVPSAQVGLASGFGMGPGVTPPL